MSEKVLQKFTVLRNIYETYCIWYWVNIFPLFQRYSLSYISTLWCTSTNLPNDLRRLTIDLILQPTSILSERKLKRTNPPRERENQENSRKREGEKMLLSFLQDQREREIVMASPDVYAAMRDWSSHTRNNKSVLFTRVLAPPRFSFFSIERRRKKESAIKSVQRRIPRASPIG